MGISANAIPKNDVLAAQTINEKAVFTFVLRPATSMGRKIDVCKVPSKAAPGILCCAEPLKHRLGANFGYFKMRGSVEGCCRGVVSL